MLKNIQFKHINLCMNEITDDIREPLLNLLKRTNEEFGVTLSGNPLSKESIDFLHKHVYDIHIHRLNSLPSDPNNPPQVDSNISLKRVAY